MTGGRWHVAAVALLAGTGTWLAIGPEATVSTHRWGELVAWMDRDAFAHDPVLGATAAGLRGAVGGGGIAGRCVAGLSNALASASAAYRLWAALCSVLLVLGAMPIFTACARHAGVGAVIALVAVVARPALGDADWGTAGGGGAGAWLALGCAGGLVAAAWRWRDQPWGILPLLGCGVLSWLHLPTGLALGVGLAIALAWEGRTRSRIVRAALGLGLCLVLTVPAACVAPGLAAPQFVEIAIAHHAAGLLPSPSGRLGIAFSAFAPLLLLSHLAWRARRGSTQEGIVRWLAVAVLGMAGAAVLFQVAAQLGAIWNGGVPLAADLISGTRFLYLGLLAYVAMGMGDFLQGRLFPVAAQWRLPLLGVLGLALLVPPESIRRAVTADGRRAATLEAARARDLRAASAWLRAHAVRPVVATDESGFRLLAGAGVTHAAGDAPFLIGSASQVAIQWAQRRSLWRNAWAQRPPTLAQLLLLGGAFGAQYVYVPVLLAPDDARTVWRGEERALVKLTQ